MGARPSAVALVFHGLNLEPSRMDSVARALAGEGIECLCPSLSGHRDVVEDGAPESRARGRLEAFRSVTRDLWIAEARESYRIARGRSEECGVPLILVGYSLGAVIGCHLLSDPRFDFDGMILFAPAFRTRWFTRALRLLRPFPRLCLPSLSPAPYRANASTPIAAYSALFESIAALDAGRERHRDIAALIFADPRDELVSYRGLRALCDGPAARPWQLVSIERPLRSDRQDFHHLVIDPHSLGDAIWEDVQRRMTAFVAAILKPDPARPPQET